MTWDEWLHILKQRHAFPVMTKYTGDLRTMMDIMIDMVKVTDGIKRPMLSIFSLFVANPKKTNDQKKILLRNRDRLLDYFKKLLNSGFRVDLFTGEMMDSFDKLVN
jgi:hypothetical protein